MPHQDVSIARYFADLPDPRVDRTKKHQLADMLVIALRAVIAGADSWEEVEAFGEAKEGWLGRLIRLPNGIPSHDTFYQVFARLDPETFGRCVADWMIRRHWSVENELHWCPAVAFQEDGNKAAAGHAGANLGLVRRVAASLLKQAPEKGSIKRKRLTATLDKDYLMQVLQGFTAN